MNELFVTLGRLSIMYLAAVAIMRLAGKREIGQMELSELVTSFMISEIACLPVTDPEVPLWKGVTLSFVVILLELAVSQCCIKVPLIKRLVSGRPCFIVIKGKLDKKAFKRARISLTEFVSAMRLDGIASLEDVDYAILEPNGNISFIPYEKEGNKNKKSAGFQHMIVCDGYVNKSELKKAGISENGFNAILKNENIKSVKDVFFLGIDDRGNTSVIKN